MARQRISASDALGAAFHSVKSEWEIFLLLVFFTTLITLLYYWPMMGANSDSISSGATEEQMLQVLKSHAVYLLVGLIPYLIVYLGAQAVWSRLSMLGRAKTLEGGLRALFQRSLKVLWRYICLIGWVFLLTLVFLLLITPIMKAAGGGLSEIEQAQPEGLLLLALILLYGVFLAAVMVLVCLFNIALHGEARDMRLPIHTCFKSMRGNLLRATGLMVLAVIAYVVVALLFLIIFGVALFGTSGLLGLIGMIIFSATGTALNFVLVSYGAYYATRLIPELAA